MGTVYVTQEDAFIGKTDERLIVKADKKKKINLTLKKFPKKYFFFYNYILSFFLSFFFFFPPFFGGAGGPRLRFG